MEWTSPSGTTARLRWRAGAARSQAARGSAAAFTAVYERHHRALYRYCRSLLGDDEEARDALQSTMTKAFAALRFEERDFELRPWLFRIAHNEAVSRLRQRHDALELSVVETLATDSPAHAVELRERLAQLRADLQDLPERQRAALVMRELSGLGHAEIAAVLGGSPQTVKQTIFDARGALHECAEGRAMPCGDVQRMLSDGDGRVRRGRRLRAHMRECRACREFAAGLAERPARLAALAPGPPMAAAASWLSRLLGATGGSGAGEASWLAGGVAGTVATKAVVVVAAAATVAGAATAVREVASRPAPTPRPGLAAQRAAGVRHAAHRPARLSARPGSVTRSRHGDATTPRAPMTGTRSRHGDATTARAPTTTVASAKAPATEHPAKAGRGERAESPRKRSHPAHPPATPPASRTHGPRKAASPVEHARGEHARRLGSAPPGQAKARHPGRAKTAHPEEAKPADPGDAKPVRAGPGAPSDVAPDTAAAGGQAKAHGPPAEPAASGRAQSSK
jgi:RNA polymerase sigma factor (sigma-70 family)